MKKKPKKASPAVSNEELETQLNAAIFERETIRTRKSLLHKEKRLLDVCGEIGDIMPIGSHQKREQRLYLREAQLTQIIQRLTTHLHKVEKSENFNVKKDENTETESFSDFIKSIKDY